MKTNYKVCVFILSIILCLPVARTRADSKLPFFDSEPDISLDFKDVSLKDLLKAFSIQSGMNFIASEGVQDRKITLYLDKVPLKRAMDQLFLANNLSYVMDKEANIFIVRDLGKPETETVTKVFYLKHATVSSSSIREEEQYAISPSANNSNSVTGATSSSNSTQQTGRWKAEEEVGITQTIKKLLSSSGKVIEDFRTNSLIVTDTPARVEVISRVIASLDVPVPQVLIEVEMLDVSKNTIDELGVKWPTTIATLDMSAASRVVDLFGNKGIDPSSRTITWPAGTSGSWDFGSWGGAHFGPTILSLVQTKLSLDLLESKTDTKFLARPRILTLSNETAEIKITTQETVGTTAATISGSSSGGGTSSSTTGTAERVETGVTLRVTPQVNVDSSEITMFVVPTVKDTSTSSFLIPNYTGVPQASSQAFKDPEERSTKCTVRVKDGETIILGGLLRNQRVETDTKVPFFGDVPFLGSLFRHKDLSKDQQRELVVFITPHIVKDRQDIKLAQSKKPAFPEREQNAASAMRDSAIIGSLDKFEK